MFIFTQEEIKNIIDFTLVTLFRHYSLYEFAFKPRIELILHTQPFINTKVNAPQSGLDQMELMDQEEADKMKGFLGSLDMANNDAFSPNNMSNANGGFDTNSNNNVTRENTQQQADQKADQDQE
mmetsp:Transcript_91825/g.126578  ORF Transcript_91825/g.126578 Transcript_91825/m.126578 type:complete len:124 (+) Transcript_91825:344-715(+)